MNKQTFEKFKQDFVEKAFSESLAVSGEFPAVNSKDEISKKIIHTNEYCKTRKFTEQKLRGFTETSIEIYKMPKSTETSIALSRHEN